MYHLVTIVEGYFNLPVVNKSNSSHLRKYQRRYFGKFNNKVHLNLQNVFVKSDLTLNVLFFVTPPL